MQYTLITKNGRIMQFFILEVAELYQVLYGGVIVDNQVFENQETLAYNE